MQEKTIEEAVCKYAKSEGWLVYKFVSPNNRGVPDRMFIKDGLVFFIEFKAPGKHPTKLQAVIAYQIREQGIDVWVCDDINRGKFLIDEANNLLTGADILMFGDTNAKPI